MTYGKNTPLRATLLAGGALIAVDAGRRNDDGGEEKLDATLDKLLTKMDACMSRMDAIEERFAKKDVEEKPGDAERVAADKAKKDAEEKEEKEKADAEMKVKADAEEEKEKEKEKADAEAKAKVDAEKEGKDVKDDAARADAAAARAETSELRKKFDDLAKKIPVERTDSDINVMTGIQARADAAFRAHGVTTGAPRFLNGEDALGYRRRLAREHQGHSPTWKEADLGALNDSVLTIAENAIYTDSLAVAADPKTHASGGLHMVKGETASGHKKTEFFGQPGDWMARFSGSKRFVTKLNPMKQEIN